MKISRRMRDEQVIKSSFSTQNMLATIDSVFCFVSFCYVGAFSIVNLQIQLLRKVMLSKTLANRAKE